MQLDLHNLPGHDIELGTSVEPAQLTIKLASEGKNPLEIIEELEKLLQEHISTIAKTTRALLGFTRQKNAIAMRTFLQHIGNGNFDVEDDPTIAKSIAESKALDAIDDLSEDIDSRLSLSGFQRVFQPGTPTILSENDNHIFDAIEKMAFEARGLLEHHPYAQRLCRYMSWSQQEGDKEFLQKDIIKASADKHAILFFHELEQQLRECTDTINSNIYLTRAIILRITEQALEEFFAN